MVARNLLVAIAAFVLGIGATLGGFALSMNSTESTTAAYGDWKLSCPPRGAAKAECALTQDILQSGTGMTAVHLQLVGGDDARRLLIVVPHGVLLKPGLGLVIGNAPLRLLHYEACDTVGCLAYLPLDAATLDSFQDAETGRIEVIWRDGKEVGFPCSLRGLTKGMSAMGWKTFKRNSWLGALLP
jgi:invasion protein IalB